MTKVLYNKRHKNKCSEILHINIIGIMPDIIGV